MLPRGSPFTETVNRGVIRLYENGDLERMAQNWFLKISDNNDLLDVPSVTLWQVALAIAIFCAISSCALATLMLECLWNCRKGRESPSTTTRKMGKVELIWPNKP